MNKSILPPNASDLEVAFDVNNAHRIETLMQATHETANTWSADECPAALLPYLAWALSVDTWNSDWSEKVKRQVIATAVFVHRHKGTRAGMDAALKSLDLGVRISEWFEYGGEPYTFRVDVNANGKGLTQKEIKSLRDIINSTKNARSWLSRLRIYISTYCAMTHAAAIQTSHRVRIAPYVPKLPNLTSTQSHSAAMTVSRRVTVGARKYV